MTSFRKRAAAIITMVALYAVTPQALADAFLVSLDGSDINAKPADFGYTVDLGTVNGQVVLTIFLNEDAAKSFGSAELKLTKGTKVVVESTFGLARLGLEVV